MWLSHQGALSEDGLLAHLRVLQALLSQLPVSPARASGQDAASDSDEEEGEEADRPASAPVSPQLCVRPRLRRPAVSMPLPYTHAQICGHT